MDRGFGEVYKAYDKGSGLYVAIKKVRLLASDVSLPSEQDMLMKCNSPFIVRYYGVIRNEIELWVKLGRKDDGIDYYGVLSLWFPISIQKRRKSTQ